MLTKKYPSEVVSIKTQIEDVYTIELKSSNGKFKYLPGQFLHLAIDSEYDGIGQWPNSRCFSMQSNPCEENIRITYSVKGSFTSLMKDSLGIGSKVWLKLPYGDLFTQKHSKENTVFIAGGTGITPFLSLFTHESFKEYINPVIYLGFRSKDFNIYTTELKLITNDIINLFYQDINGLLDIKKIFLINGINKSYFISGPPQMVKAFKLCLLEYGVLYSNIHTDDWE